MDEIKKTLEGEQIDNLEGTSPSGEDGVQLNSSPVPTEEEIKEANMVSANNESPDVEEPVEKYQLASDTPVATEIVENETAENENVETSAPVVEEQTETEPVHEERIFTQSQVNDLVGKTRMETREQTYRAIYGRYGVDDEVGMDELVGNAQRYETVRGEYDEARKGWETTNAARDAELTEVKEHVALLESGIDRARFDDAKAIIKAKGLEITVENIQNELATHPEWKGTKTEEINPNFRQNPNGQPQSINLAPESTIKVLGNEGNSDSGGMSEEEFAMKKLFKL